MRNYFLLFALIIAMPTVYAQTAKIKKQPKKEAEVKVEEKSAPVEPKKEEAKPVTETSSGLGGPNLRIGGLEALIGSVNIQPDFAVSNSWTAGPSFQYFNRKIDNNYRGNAYSIGIRGNYYFSRSVFTQGWYVGPSLSYMKVGVRGSNSDNNNIEGSANGFAVRALLGYQWMWENFNINLGAGPVYYNLGNIKVKDSDGGSSKNFKSYDGARLSLEFTIGWKF